MLTHHERIHDNNTSEYQSSPFLWYSACTRQCILPTNITGPRLKSILFFHFHHIHLYIYIYRYIHEIDWWYGFTVSFMNALGLLENHLPFTSVPCCFSWQAEGSILVSKETNRSPSRYTAEFVLSKGALNSSTVLMYQLIVGSSNSSWCNNDSELRTMMKTVTFNCEAMLFGFMYKCITTTQKTEQL